MIYTKEKKLFLNLNEDQKNVTPDSGPKTREPDSSIVISDQALAFSVSLEEQTIFITQKKIVKFNDFEENHSATPTVEMNVDDIDLEVTSVKLSPDKKLMLIKK
jgi:hypothetical protein